jgi:protein tyrosine/serine phosphatase
MVIQQFPKYRKMKSMYLEHNQSQTFWVQSNQLSLNQKLKNSPLYFRSVAKRPPSNSMLCDWQHLKTNVLYLSQKLKVVIMGLACKLFFKKWKLYIPSKQASICLFKDEHAPIRNFYCVDKNYYRGAQPGIQENDQIDECTLKKALTYLRDTCHIRTILNLRDHSDLRPEFSHLKSNHIEIERKIINELNDESTPAQQIKFVHIPIHSGKALTDNDLSKILTEITKPDQPIYVHCKAGIDRTGIVSFLYRAKNYSGASASELYQEMQYCGHNPKGIWSGYIKNIQYHLSTNSVFSAFYRINKQELDALAFGNQKISP